MDIWKWPNLLQWKHLPLSWNVSVVDVSLATLWLLYLLDWHSGWLPSILKIRGIEKIFKVLWVSNLGCIKSWLSRRSVIKSLRWKPTIISFFKMIKYCSEGLIMVDPAMPGVNQVFLLLWRGPLAILPLLGYRHWSQTSEVRNICPLLPLSNEMGCWSQWWKMKVKKTPLKSYIWYRLYVDSKSLQINTESLANLKTTHMLHFHDFENIKSTSLNKHRCGVVQSAGVADFKSPPSPQAVTWSL